MSNLIIDYENLTGLNTLKDSLNNNELIYKLKNKLTKINNPTRWYNNEKCEASKINNFIYKWWVSNNEFHYNKLDFKILRNKEQKERFIYNFINDLNLLYTYLSSDSLDNFIISFINIYERYYLNNDGDYNKNRIIYNYKLNGKHILDMNINNGFDIITNLNNIGEYNEENTHYVKKEEIKEYLNNNITIFKTNIIFYLFNMITTSNIYNTIFNNIEKILFGILKQLNYNTDEEIKFAINQHIIERIINKKNTIAYKLIFDGLISYKKEIEEKLKEIIEILNIMKQYIKIDDVLLDINKNKFNDISDKIKTEIIFGNFNEIFPEFGDLPNGEISHTFAAPRYKILNNIDIGYTKITHKNIKDYNEFQFNGLYYTLEYIKAGKFDSDVGHNIIKELEGDFNYNLIYSYVEDFIKI